jgi:RimJ/RimL family protein N-acetyltransferase
MTFYHIIFGILFLAAFVQVLRSFNEPDLSHLSEAITLMLLIIADVIFTSHVLEEKKRPYSVRAKGIDLLSFVLLSIAIFALNPTKEGFFGVAAASRYDFLNGTAVFWCMVVLYWGLLVAWNVVEGVYRSMPRGTQWWWQLLLGGPLVVMAMAAVIAPGSSFVYGFSILVTVMVFGYLLLYKRHVLNAMSDERPRPRTPEVTLTSLTSKEEEEIQNWPPYPPQFMALDYALRRGTGWLTAFPADAGNNRFAAWAGGELVGFSILTKTADDEAEFYVAIHPKKLGTGIGTEVTRQTKVRGFDQLNLRRIWLKVRTWHEGGRRVYERMGFRNVGSEFTENVGGREDQFIKMEVYSN